MQSTNSHSGIDREFTQKNALSRIDVRFEGNNTIPTLFYLDKPKEEYRITFKRYDRFLPEINPYPVILCLSREESMEADYLSNRISIPNKFFTLIGNRTKIMIKIFLIYKSKFKYFYKFLTSKDHDYFELLSVIEKLRAKNLHRVIQKKVLSGGSVNFLYPAFVTSFIFKDQIGNFEAYERSCRTLRSALKNIMDSTKLLQKNDQFPKELIGDINPNIDLMLNENWRVQDTQIKRPKLIPMASRQFDAIDDFIFTLYQDLIKDLLKERNRFRMCKYEFCSHIYQPKPNQSSPYCTPGKCSHDRWHHCKHNKESIKIQQNIRKKLFGIAPQNP